ncbi:MAG: bis(5'-nucleosyl)-tetraphosphatase (symmetrical) YqeK [Candidatus Eremiobacteraeota bacterium]|nr:bis(5'-nucleosyl)-tetraphosphatase (symmetrical) YqeK [Candidatus Eremiobacteraeota bacterium]MBC5828079.1 bis(5'-nucleosyl)-tetraphosphatase (symmetrical) YqeK [Candidatus Eremiobacteraeota bacterium]
MPCAAAAPHQGRFSAADFLGLCKTVREQLPRTRYRHVLGVARTAEKLAARYGASPLKARLAGMLHDIARAWRPEELFAYATAHGLAVSAAERTSPVLLHARVGADIARRRFGVDDPELLGAMERHTLAVPEMTTLEKVVYLADSLEPSRTFGGRDELAAACERSLDEGLLACVKGSLDHLMLRNIAFAPETVALYNELVQRIGRAA